MKNLRYPALMVNHEKFRENVRLVTDKCREHGIEVAGVIKASNGMPRIAEDFVASGASIIASSRLEQLERAELATADVPLLLIRIPMLCEVEDVVRVADISLNSELKVLEALNAEALRQRKTHKVILMADLGDLREGYFEADELIETALIVENRMEGLVLAGIGTNLGCYGSVKPTAKNMKALSELAERIETRIGRELEYVSGGASSSMMPVLDNVMPAKVNMLRIGALVYTGGLDELAQVYGYKWAEKLNDDAFVLRAQVIEKKVKPTHPIGELGVDAFGKKREYVDRGNRLRVLLAVGRADYGDIEDILPELSGSFVVGASGDHTILDIEDCRIKPEVGDVIEFRLKYSALLRLSGSENVRIYNK